jgi:hypothetical protein
VKFWRVKPGFLLIRLWRATFFRGEPEGLLHMKQVGRESRAKRKLTRGWTRNSIGREREAPSEEKTQEGIGFRTSVNSSWEARTLRGSKVLK